MDDQSDSCFNAHSLEPLLQLRNSFFYVLIPVRIGVGVKETFEGVPHLWAEGRFTVVYIEAEFTVEIYTELEEEDSPECDVSLVELQDGVITVGDRVSVYGGD